MSTAPVPSCLRSNLAASLAYEQGHEWGAGGLSRDTNPFDPFNPLCAAWDEGWCDGRDTLKDEES